MTDMIIQILEISDW